MNSTWYDFRSACTVFKTGITLMSRSLASCSFVPGGVMMRHGSRRCRELSLSLSLSILLSFSPLSSFVSLQVFSSFSFCSAISFSFFVSLLFSSISVLVSLFSLLFKMSLSLLSFSNLLTLSLNTGFVIGGKKSPPGFDWFKFLPF